MPVALEARGARSSEGGAASASPADPAGRLRAPRLLRGRRDDLVIALAATTPLGLEAGSLPSATLLFAPPLVLLTPFWSRGART
jgi:hypothetical protein